PAGSYGGLIYNKLPNGGLIHNELPNDGLIHSELPNSKRAEITLFIALQLRVVRLEQEMSEVKKTDHSADVLASIKSQVPTVVDEYLGIKLDDALLKILE
ncbi:hypothetical protein Tco_1224455, partial [Tanacetum coccineum]